MKIHITDMLTHIKIEATYKCGISFIKHINNSYNYTVTYFKCKKCKEDFLFEKSGFKKSEILKMQKLGLFLCCHCYDDLIIYGDDEDEKI